MPHNVLIVEDQPGWAALVQSALRNGKLPACEISAAQDYDEAVRLVREKRFEIALCDYTLAPAGTQGAKTGLDVARELRAASPEAAIFLVTMADPERLQSRCDELGVTLIEKGRGDLEETVLREVRDALTQ